MLIFIIFIIIWASAGFKLQLKQPINIYASWENKPLKYISILTELEPGDNVISVGCFDNKSDQWFQVLLEDGRVGYLHDFKYESSKQFIPSEVELDYFMKDPIASLQCLTMVPFYSSE